MGRPEDFYTRVKELASLALVQPPSVTLIKQWTDELCRLEIQAREERTRGARPKSRIRLVGRKPGG